MPNKNLNENKLKRLVAKPISCVVKLISKKTFVSQQYKYITHHKMSWDSPKRYTEKLQILRLYEYPKNDLVCQCAGRVGARKFLKEQGFELNLIKIYGVFNNFDEIDFEKLPNQFVMKCTHACSYNYICFDKKRIEHKKLRKQFNKWLKTNYGKKTVEPHYSKIKPQIIIEELLLENNYLPKEYKIHCFNGTAKYMYVVTDRNKDIRYNNYYIDWKEFDGAQFNGWKKSDKPLTKPNNWDEMVKIAEALSKPFPFVRVDLFNINNKIYFSELTFTPAKGTLIFDDDKADFEIGEWLDISAN